ncbi:MAG: DNA repair protein RecN [Candidatus Omnitrophota bacterium]
MLTQFTIQNFGLIDRLTVEFQDGLNVLTGETGAGKSILIDALRFCLGERLDAAQVRDPSRECLVEAAFDLPRALLKAYPVFADYVSGGDPTLIISRAYLPEGRARVKINGRAVTVAQLKELGDHLVDLHGPHDHQMLLASSSHIGILDSLCDSAALMKEYSVMYAGYQGLQKELHEIRSSAASRARDIDLLTHQVRELSRVSLEQEKYDELLETQKRLNNAEKLYAAASELIQILDHDETGLAEALRRAFGPLKTLGSLDEGARSFAETLSGVQSSTDGLISELRSYIEGLSFEPDEARDINARYDAYYEILRKYGPTLDDAKKLYGEAKARLTFLENLDQNDADVHKKIAQCLAELETIAARITRERKKTAAALQKTIETELRELGIAHVRFECRIGKADIGARGHDDVAFYISPNAGEEMKPLAEIVSSGEAARVMLALKKALISVDPIPVLIFDEIDAQIGGRLGDILGRKLRELSQGRQVILITHLPQIAGYAGAHFKVVKRVEGARTLTAVESLDEVGRVREMAKMMSGEKESAIAITHAQQMLKGGRAQRTAHEPHRRAITDTNLQ